MLARVDALVKANVDVVVVDSAHGHSENILRAVREIKAAYPELQVIAGKRCYRSCHQGSDRCWCRCSEGWNRTWLYLYDPCCCRYWCSADHIVMDCYEVAKRYGIPIIADSGIKYSGDITRQSHAGNVCMMGSMFADAMSPGTFELYQGRKYRYIVEWDHCSYGEWQQGPLFQENAKKLVPEGVEGRVAYKGTP